MKGVPILRLLGVFSLFFIITACVPEEEVKPGGENEGQIRRVQVHDSADKTEIVVEGPQPMIYTTFQLQDPLRLVVDMAGVTFAESVSQVPVNNGVIIAVTPKSVEASRVARLEIGLSHAIEPVVRTEGTNLIVEVAKSAEAKAPETKAPETAAAEVKPAEAKAPEAPAPEVKAAETASAEPVPTPPVPAPEAAPAAPVAAPAASGEEPKAPTAKHIKDIKVSSNGTLQILFTADGTLAPQVYLLGKNRLVVDFVGVKTAMKPKFIPVKNDPRVKRIRLGAHPDKVRVVADLIKPVSYHVEQQKDGLLLQIGQEEPGAVAAPTALSAASVAPATLIPAPGAEEGTGAQKSAETPPAAPPAAEAPPAPQKESVKEAQGEPSGEAPVQTAEETTQKEAATPPPAAEAAGKEKEKGGQGMRPRAKLTLENGTPPPAQGEFVPTRYTGRRISLDFQDADVTNVIRLIADVSGLNMVVGDDVKGRITLKLMNVPWDQALDIILKMNNLGQIRNGNIVRIATLANITRQQDEEAKAKETLIKAEDPVTRVIRLNYADTAILMASLKKNLSPRGEIMSDIRTNSLIIKDVPSYVDQIARLVKNLDLQTPQVMIEARIVQVNPTFDQSLGIQWGGNIKAISNSTQGSIQGTQGTAGPSGIAFGTTNPDFAVNLPASSSQGSLGFTLGRFTGNPFNLDLRISAGEIQGLTRIVSTPKVSVLDNQEAKIEEGESIPYQTVSASGTQTVFIDASLVLSVKPHITGDRSIIMVLKVSKDAPGDTRQGAAGPSIFKKEASTNILMKDGETTVIGGIYETTDVTNLAGVPFLMKIPFLGWLFKTEDKQQQKTELLVFITPRIVS